MEAGLGRICAMYRMPTARKLDLFPSESKTPRYLKLWLAFSGSCTRSASPFRNLHTAAV